MKIEKILLFSFAICMVSLGTNLHAQMDNRISGDPATFKMLKSRVAIVEVKEEDPEMIAALSKNKKDPEALQHYKDFIINNNKMLKQAIDKYWKFNSTIQYKTTSELKDIIGTSNQFVIISYQTLTGGTFERRTGGSPVATYGMPLIWYYRSEKAANKEPDDYMYLPVASLPDNEASPECWGYAQSDYDFAIMQMQANIQYMIQVNKKVLYEDYIKDVWQTNCGKMQNETLVIDKNQLDEKTDESDIKKYYKGPYALTDGQANDDFENHEQGKEIVFSYAYGIASGSISFVTTSALYFSKAIVDCGTGNIMYYYRPPNGMALGGGSTYQYGLRKLVFYYMQKCK